MHVFDVAGCLFVNYSQHAVSFSKYILLNETAVVRFRPLKRGQVQQLVNGATLKFNWPKSLCF